LTREKAVDNRRWTGKGIGRRSATLASALAPFSSVQHTRQLRRRMQRRAARTNDSISGRFDFFKGRSESSVNSTERLTTGEKIRTEIRVLKFLRLHSVLPQSQLVQHLMLRLGQIPILDALLDSTLENLDISIDDRLLGRHSLVHQRRHRLKLNMPGSLRRWGEFLIGSKSRESIVDFIGERKTERISSEIFLGEGRSVGGRSESSSIVSPSPSTRRSSSSVVVVSLLLQLLRRLSRWSELRQAHCCTCSRRVASHLASTIPEQRNLLVEVPEGHGVWGI
ncbi:hypothetical protein PFISCL1PPCAC_19132, partial [Pristionchus fissidentatus]